MANNFYRYFSATEKNQVYNLKKLEFFSLFLHNFLK